MLSPSPKKLFFLSLPNFIFIFSLYGHFLFSLSLQKTSLLFSISSSQGSFLFCISQTPERSFFIFVFSPRNSFLFFLSLQLIFVFPPSLLKGHICFLSLKKVISVFSLYNEVHFKILFWLSLPLSKFIFDFLSLSHLPLSLSIGSFLIFPSPSQKKDSFVLFPSPSPSKESFFFSLFLQGVNFDVLSFSPKESFLMFSLSKNFLLMCSPLPLIQF